MSLYRRSEECSSSPGDYAYMELRIASIFIVLLASAIGVLIPLAATRFPRLRMPVWLYFFARYFGSGVIVSTAFIHLLFEAHENLSSPCLPDGYRRYPYAFALTLAGIFGTFLIEIITKYKVAGKGNKGEKSATDSSCSHGPAALAPLNEGNVFNPSHRKMESNMTRVNTDLESDMKIYERENNNMSNAHEKTLAMQNSDSESDTAVDPKLALQISNICLLEFGIVFHSIFVGLTVAVSGPEFKTLFPVIVFHQLFEGMGLGARLARTQWSPEKAWISWFFALLFSITTPIGIAVGLGVRKTFELNSTKSLVTTGIFDGIAAGILIYSALVELMGREFLESDEFEEASLGRILGAYTWMALGCAMMALLGAWA